MKSEGFSRGAMNRAVVAKLESVSIKTLLFSINESLRCEYAIVVKNPAFELTEFDCKVVQSVTHQQSGKTEQAGKNF